MASRKIEILAVLGVLAFTGCPYTAGCETSAVTPDDGGMIDPGDAGPEEDAQLEDATEEDSAIPLGPILPNCQGLTAQCNGESCCTAANVPGGTFNRLNDVAFPATVSDFRLDVYEVTVGRFRAFVNAGKGTKKSPPVDGTGANPKIPGSGWTAALNAQLTDDKDGFVSALLCDMSLYNAYNEVPGKNDTLPVNCMAWSEAQAFCIWDGGRLPTEAELNYAAAGGSEQREYPWVGPFDATKLGFGCQSGDSIADPGAPICTFANYTAVGTHPTGKGRWGHHDLSGNVWERALDFYVDPLRLTPCVDCADLVPNADGRVIRGGALNWAMSYQRTLDRTGVNSEPLDVRTNTVGFRCARAFVP